MELGEYQKKAEGTWGEVLIGDNNFLYPSLGLAGEAGEFLNKIKKIFRDDKGALTEDRRVSLLEELGDVLWYVTIISKELGSSLEEVATMNNKKLESRLERGVVHGSGDNR